MSEPRMTPEGYVQRQQSGVEALVEVYRAVTHTVMTVVNESVKKPEETGLQVGVGKFVTEDGYSFMAIGPMYALRELIDKYDRAGGNVNDDGPPVEIIDLAIMEAATALGKERLMGMAEKIKEAEKEGGDKEDG